MPWYAEGEGRCENGSEVQGQGTGETSDKAIHMAEESANQQCVMMGTRFYGWDGGLTTRYEGPPIHPPPRIVGPHWLDGASDGKSVGLVNAQTPGTRWKIEQAPEGSVYLRSWNPNLQSDDHARWLDGASDGKTVSLVNAQTPGTRWKIEQAPEGIVYLHSWNPNLQSDDHARWLDGASDGKTVSLVDGGPTAPGGRSNRPPRAASTCSWNHNFES